MLSSVLALTSKPFRGEIGSLALVFALVLASLVKPDLNALCTVGNTGFIVVLIVNGQMVGQILCYPH